MFFIEENFETSFTKIILSDNVTGARVEVLPECGAILHAFYIQAAGGSMNIVEQYETESDWRENVESKGFKSAKLSPFVCRLKAGTYQYLGQQYTVQKFFLNGDALHGLIYDRLFTVEDKYAGDDCARVVMRYAYRGEDPGFPFRYDCVVVYELLKDNHLRLSTTIINNDAGPIPMADGWHPYFTFNEKVDDLEMQMKTVAMLEFDSALIPTGNYIPYNQFNQLKKLGNTNFDNCFTLDNQQYQPVAVLRSPAKRVQLEIFPESSYPFLQIYIPPHRMSIAVENLSAAPDALNNNIGLLTMPMGTQKTFVTHYRVKVDN